MYLIKQVLYLAKMIAPKLRLIAAKLVIIAFITNAFDAFSLKFSRCLTRSIVTASIVVSTIDTFHGSLGLQNIPVASAASNENSGPTRSENVQLSGIKNGRLLKCNVKSNCVSTSSINSVDKYAKPWTYSKSATDEFDDLLSIIKSDQYLHIADEDKSNFYLRVEAKSGFPPNGIDDIEFLFNDKDKIITYRSNSRVAVGIGGSEVIGDGGAIRNRLISIQRKLGVSEMNTDDEIEDYFRVSSGRNLFQRIQDASQPSDINFVDNSVPKEETI